MAAGLYGKQLNVAGDLPARALGDTGLLKALRGGDLLTVEEKGRAPFAFVCKARNIFSANKFPKTEDDSRAFYRSWQILYLANVFETTRDILPTITTETELAGFFNLLTGYFLPILMQRDNFTYAKSPEENQNLYDSKSDSAKLFLDACIRSNPNGELYKDELWAKYTAYCEREGLILETEKAFRQTLNTSGLIVAERRKDGRRLYVGMQYVPPNANQNDARPVPINVNTISDFKTALQKYEGLQTVLPTLPTFSPIAVGKIGDRINIRSRKNVGNLVNAATDNQFTIPKDLKTEGYCPVCGNVGNIWELRERWLCATCLKAEQQKNNSDTNV